MYPPNTWSNEISRNLPHLKIVKIARTTPPPMTKVEKVKESVKGAAIVGMFYSLPSYIKFIDEVMK